MTSNADDPERSYEALGALIARHNPYGPQDKVEFPKLTTDEHIGTAWWLREVVATNPISSCNDKMTDLEEQLCTRVAFPWSRDPFEGVLGGEQDTYQACKAVLVPYTYYRDRDGAPMQAYMGLYYFGSGGHREAGKPPETKAPVDPPANDIRGTVIKDAAGNYVDYVAPDAQPQSSQGSPTQTQKE